MAMRLRLASNMRQSGHPTIDELTALARLPYLDAHPSADHGAWRERVSAVLKGKPAESLGSQTYDGIPVAPFYPAATQTISVTRPTRGWSIVQRADHPDPSTAGAQALEDLENGADGLQLVFANAIGAYGFGLPSDAALAMVLRDVVLDAEVPLELDCADGTGGVALALAETVEQSGADVSATRIAFGIDPFAAVARGSGPTLDGQSALAACAKSLRARAFHGPLFVADARLIHAAGGSEAQELGYALAAGVACLRLLDAAGFAAEHLTAAVAFRVAIDPDEFVGIAKLRALRQLWAAIARDCGLPPPACYIHAETSWRALTRRDPDVNMLRATLAIFAAAVGGADRISVLPHTQAVGLPDAHARRVARNAQLVLREEANLDKVSDPAAGSGGIEALTAALCEKGWDVFRAIEGAGGLRKALDGSAFRESVAAVSAARAKNVARRKDAITGVSEFPLSGEVPPAVELRASVAVENAPFAPHRTAERFERLRDRSDETLATTGARPKIFLATLGPLATHAARATFAKNLFEAGGFVTVTSDGEDTDAALVHSFEESGAAIACLCGSDAVYAERAAAAAAALVAKATRIVLAGRPGDQETAWRKAGITDFAYAGADVLALLTSLAEG